MAGPGRSRHQLQGGEDGWLCCFMTQHKVTSRSRFICRPDASLLLKRSLNTAAEYTLLSDHIHLCLLPAVETHLAGYSSQKLVFFKAFKNICADHEDNLEQIQFPPPSFWNAFGRSMADFIYLELERQQPKGD